MAFLRGLILFVTSAILLFVESYFLIIEPLASRTVQTGRDWAITIPILLISFLIGGSTLWIGYVMMTTPEPIRLDYEEAYDLAQAERVAENESKQE